MYYHVQLPANEWQVYKTSSILDHNEMIHYLCLHSTEPLCSSVELSMCNDLSCPCVTIMTMSMWGSEPETSGLKKIPISPWLVTLFHICGVIQTLQSPILPHWYCWKLCSSTAALMLPCLALMSLHWVLISSHRMASVWVFHDVHNILRVFHDFLLVVHDVLQCFMMFYYV